MVSARYVIVENHDNNDEYLIDYKRLHDILSEKYGNRRIDEQWHDDNFKFDKGFALKQGDFTMTGNLVSETPEIFGFALTILIAFLNDATHSKPMAYAGSWLDRISCNNKKNPVLSGFF